MQEAPYLHLAGRLIWVLPLTIASPACRRTLAQSVMFLVIFEMGPWAS